VRKDKIRAIVLTYDRNHPITDHMICAYEHLWPDHPFIFRIPYNKIYPKWLEEKYGDKVEIIQIDSRIKETVIQLLDGIDDNIVYWCLDDKYPAWVDQKSMNVIHNHILDNDSIEGIAFVGTTKNGIFKGSNEYIDKFKLITRKNFRKFFQHQYVKKDIF